VIFTYGAPAAVVVIQMPFPESLKPTCASETFDDPSTSNPMFAALNVVYRPRKLALGVTKMAWLLLTHTAICCAVKAEIPDTVTTEPFEIVSAGWLLTPANTTGPPSPSSSLERIVMLFRNATTTLVSVQPAAGQRTSITEPAVLHAALAALVLA